MQPVCIWHTDPDLVSIDNRSLPCYIEASRSTGVDIYINSIGETLFASEGNLYLLNEGEVLIQIGRQGQDLGEFWEKARKLLDA